MEHFSYMTYILAPLLPILLQVRYFHRRAFCSEVYGNMPPDFEHGYMQHIMNACNLFKLLLSQARAKSFTAFTQIPVAALEQRGTKRTASGENKKDMDVQQGNDRELQLEIKIVQLQEKLKHANKSTSDKVAATGHANLDTIEQLQNNILLLEKKLKASVDEKNANKAYKWTNESVLRQHPAWEDFRKDK